MMTNEDLAYAAGFFDGEGSITIHHNCKPSPRGRSPNHTLQVVIGNTDPLVVSWLHQHFGGFLVNRPAATIRHKPVTMWGVRAAMALPFLEAIEPFVRMKSRQVKIAIAFQRSKKRHQGGTGNFLSEEVVMWREQQRVDIRNLNGRHPILEGEKT